MAHRPAKKVPSKAARPVRKHKPPKPRCPERRVELQEVYLRIEMVPGYSPVEPSTHGGPYRRDCMRSPGHEDGGIPLAEVEARRLDAVVYREYVDPGYLIPKPDKLVLADSNEPVYTSRVPGTVIWTHPGRRLVVHVLNADSMPHSLHVHGLGYGIDSDGSWPFGAQSADGRRSDEICPGSTWTYVYDVTEDMVGAWPFHDHARMPGESINRGLFGGIVVLPEEHCDYSCCAELPPLIRDFLDDVAHDAHHLAHGHHAPTALPSGAGAMTTHHGAGHHGGGSLPSPRSPFQWELEARLAFLEEWAQLAYAHPRCDHDDDVLHVPIFIHMIDGRQRGSCLRERPSGSRDGSLRGDLRHSFHVRLPLRDPPLHAGSRGRGGR